MHKSSSPIDEDHSWCFISGVKDKKESFEATMCRIVKEEMGIKIDNVKRVKDKYFHARLTDDNVNSIKRGENQLLDFFSLNDLKKLSLSDPTQEFISKYGLHEVEVLFSSS